MCVSRFSKCLGLLIGSLILAGCGESTAPAKSSLDNMSESERAAKIQQTVDQQMDMNKKAMEQQGQEMKPPEGAGFVPPESMNKYMKKQAGGGGGAGAASPPSSESSEPPKK